VTFGKNTYAFAILTLCHEGNGILTTQHTVDYSRKWYVLAAVATGIFLSTIDSSIVNVALPTLVQSFGVEFAVVQWVVLAYLLTVVTLIPSMGRLGDMIGKKPLYMTGFAIFTIGSALCGLAPTAYWLIGFRVLQALGASVVLALGTAILTEAFPPTERGKALGFGGTMVSIGIVTGPVLGGLLIGALSWHWIFFVNLPVGAIGLAMVLRFVPDIRPAGGQRFDVGGALSLCISLLCLLLGLTFAQRLGFSEARVVALLVAWLILLAAFISIESRHPQPMISLALFRNRLFSINLITGFLTFVSFAGTTILIPFYLQNILQYSPQSVGLLMVVVPAGMGIAAPLAGSLSDRFGSRPIIVIGLSMVALGFFAASTLTTATTAPGYVLRFVPLGIGIGIFNAPNNSAIMGSVPRTRLGVASGLVAITRTLGQTVGIAVMGTVWAARVALRQSAVPVGGATAAAAGVQVAALHDTYLLSTMLAIISLALAIWSLIQERRGALGPVPQPDGL